MSFKRTLPFSFLICATFFLVPGFTTAETSDAINDLAARINRERTLRGMLPYALSASLSAAAQAHANDIARTGVDSHTGSDGSDVRVRVKRAGYASYSWGYRVGENWAYYFDAATAMNMWMHSEPHTKNILHQVYREFGIGIARKSNGAFIYVVDFGAQPNVLPVFIQNDAQRGAGLVTIALSNETYAASGDGAQTIGLATQVEISNSPSFADAQWQNYASKINWTLAPGSGAKTVYVKFRDARGRTTTSSDSTNMNAPSFPTLTPFPTNTTRPRPTGTVTPLPTLARGGVGGEVAPSPTTITTSEVTATPDAVIAQLITPEPLPTLAPDSAYDSDDNQPGLIIPGIVGVSLLLLILSIVLYVKKYAKQ